MLLTHALVYAADVHQHFEAASILRVIRNAVVAFLAIVFVLGGFIGFLLGRAVGRR